MNRWVTNILGVANVMFVSKNLKICKFFINKIKKSYLFVNFIAQEFFTYLKTSPFRRRAAELGQCSALRAFEQGARDLYRATPAVRDQTWYIMCTFKAKQ
jgi:hypothetical protein